MLHSYCIRKAGDAPPREFLGGVGGEAVRLLENDSLGMWVSEIAKADVPRLERLRQHERVVREALRSATPLPMRYRTSFKDDSEAMTLLESRRAEFEETLSRVAGQVEMGIRVSLAGHNEPPPRVSVPEGPVVSGREYLERRREQLTEEKEAKEGAEKVLSELVLELADLGVPAAKIPVGSGEVIGSLAHLVQRTGVRPYRGRVAQLQQQHEDLYLVVSGPWAPYSFV